MLINNKKPLKSLVWSILTQFRPSIKKNYTMGKFKKRNSQIQILNKLNRYQNVMCSVLHKS